MPFKTIPVPAQTDAEYSAISSNQCSWAAYEFVKHSSKLRHALYKNNIDDFLETYKKCLHDASILRKNTKDCLYGENIDTPIIQENYKNTVSVCCTNGVYKNEDPDFLSVLHEDLKREFYTRKYFENDMENVMKAVSGITCLLVSRHGQSFALLPYFGRYLICDSHLHEASVVSKEDAIKHILMDYGGHLHVTILEAFPS